MRIYLTPILVLSLFSSQAFARRGDQRGGFNFGTTLRVIDDTQEYDTEGSSSTRTTSTYSVTPHVGYAFWGLFNLGINSTIESSSIFEQTKYVGSDTRQVDTRSSLSGGGLFGRLLFGKVMYMEATIGAYRGNSSVTTTTLSGNSEFSGTSETDHTTGIGYGYGFGLGLEIPIDNGFYFTGAYTTRSLFLKDYQDTTVDSRQNNLKSEFQFGISHYLR